MHPPKRSYYLSLCFRTLSLVLVSSWAVWGCTEEVFEDIPAYVHIESVGLETRANQQGSASANISEIWLFVADVFLGAYATDATIPILRNGPTALRIEAGIRDNGIAATPEIYPFYAPINRELPLQPQRIDSLTLTFAYREDVNFALLENYENGLTVFQDLITGSPFNRLRADEEAAFEGRLGGLIRLSTDFPSVELASVRRFRDLQRSGIPVYLEMDYRSEAPVQFGILGFPADSDLPVDARYVAGFNPSETWKKIYFNLSQAVAESQGDEFKLILQTSLPRQNDGTYTRNSAQVRIDNLKLLHFE